MGVVIVITFMVQILSFVEYSINIDVNAASFVDFKPTLVVIDHIIRIIKYMHFLDASAHPAKPEFFSARRAEGFDA